VQILGDRPGQRTDKLAVPVRLVESGARARAETGGVNVHAADGSPSTTPLLEGLPSTRRWWRAYGGVTRLARQTSVPAPANAYGEAAGYGQGGRSATVSDLSGLPRTPWRIRWPR
jgi:hypothetical protein